MRALLNGERTGSLGIVAGLAGVICLLIASIGLNVKHATDLKDLKHVIYLRCQQRQVYDQANHASIEADAQLYRQLLDIANRAPKQTNPRLAELVAEQRRVIDEARARKETAVRAGVIGSCAAYR